MKKILILANELGVIYKFRYELLKKLILNYQVEIITSFEGDEFYLKELKKIGIKLIEVDIDRRGKNIISEIVLIVKYFIEIKKSNPDIVLTYTIKPNIYGGIICRIFKIKYINTITGLGTAFQKKNLLRKVVIFLYKKALKKSKKVFFQNKDNVDLFIKENIILKNQVILTNGSGVNLTKFLPLEKNEIKKDIQFLFVGRIMKEKGIEELLNAFDMLKESFVTFELNILGQFEEEEYKEILKNKEYINYLGVSTDIREIIRNMDCLINPSWHEGMSNVLLEAGAMKIFLIASDISGCNEIVLNNNTGLIFEVKNAKKLKDCIIKYINMSDKKREELKEKQYKHIQKNFNREIVIKEYLEIIDHNI